MIVATFLAIALSQTQGGDIDPLLIAAAPQVTTTPGSRPIDRFSWLIGGTWTANASKLGKGMREISTRYQWSQNRTYVEFSTVFASETGAVVNYSGMIFNDPSTAATGGGYRMWYTDAKGAITEGAVSPGSGDDWSLNFLSENKPYRVDILRQSADSYRWSLYSQSSSSWSPVFSLDFNRERQ